MFYITGGSPKIQKAFAEEFIHIFVNSSARLTEFLEHMIKVGKTNNYILSKLFFIFLHLIDVSMF